MTKLILLDEEKITDPKIVKDILSKGVSSSSHFAASGVDVVGNDEEINIIPSKNGLYDAFLAAYNAHATLQISPDDIWFQILHDFGTYISDNAEKYRSVFVSHQGKETLSVKIGPVATASAYRCGVQQLVLAIEAKSVLPMELFRADFSTTTSVRATAVGIATMKTVEKYYSFKMELCCGIRAVQMEGCVEDWQNLVSKVDGLRKISKVGDDISGWLGRVSDIAKRLLKTYEGIDMTYLKKWWSQVITKEYYGSGGQSNHSGWLSKMFLYDGDGHVRLSGFSIDPYDIPSSKVQVSFDLEDEAGTIKKQLSAGHFGFVMNEETNVVSPYLNWIVSDEKEKEKQTIMGWYYDMLAEDGRDMSNCVRGN
jgi:hypothetical protein